MTDTRITKAIIPVAGFGTRRLPITKAIEKCMLPVGNRPAVDYVVQDCLRAGITDIIFVVGEDFEQLKRYYGHHERLEAYLADQGKQAELEQVRALADQARFHYVVQDPYLPYGTSTAVYVARDFIEEGERFVVAFGDNFFYDHSGGSEVAHLLEAFQQAGSDMAMVGVEIPRERTVNYGVISAREAEGKLLYDHIVERPATPEAAPSNLINASFFVFESGVLPFIAANVETSAPGERLLITALNAYIHAGNTMVVVKARGHYLDCGKVDEWLQANNYVAGQA
jgi:UTP--glucose-1-phosphate uridylyltransferase